MEVHADDQGIIIKASGSEVLGYRNEELVGEKVETLVPFKYREAHRRGLKQWSDKGTRKVMGTWLLVEARQRDGSLVRMELVLTERLAQGGQRVVTAIINPVDDHEMFRLAPL